jgi:hypothetical protein
MFTGIRPDFEVVKEGRILYLGSGYRRFTLFALGYDKKSSLVAEGDKISILRLSDDIYNIFEFMDSKILL